MPKPADQGLCYCSKYRRIPGARFCAIVSTVVERAMVRRAGISPEFVQYGYCQQEPRSGECQGARRKRFKNRKRTVIRLMESNADEHASNSTAQTMARAAAWDGLNFRIPRVEESYYKSKHGRDEMGRPQGALCCTAQRDASSAVSTDTVSYNSLTGGGIKPVAETSMEMDFVTSFTPELRHQYGNVGTSNLMVERRTKNAQRHRQLSCH
jgi:hypothetical protein